MLVTTTEKFHLLDKATLLQLRKLTVRYHSSMRVLLKDARVRFSDWVVLVRDGEEVIGWSHLGVTGFCLRLNVFVRHSHRRQGIGGEMVRCAKQIMVEKFSSRTILSTSPHNPISKKFFNKVLSSPPVARYGGLPANDGDTACL